MTQLWPDGDAIGVVVNERGGPVLLTWAGGQHVVERIANRWRVDEAWWTGRIWRDYFKVTTEAGWLIILYHDLTTDAWYVQRLYD